MNNVDQQYNALFEKILEEGEWEENRTGIDTKSIFAQSLTFDLREGFPIFTTRQMPFRSFAGELECFIQGFTSKQDFIDRKCFWWGSWANPQKVPYGNDEETLGKLSKEEDLGNIYGYQYRNFGGYSYDLVETPEREPSLSSLSFSPPYNLVDKKNIKVIKDLGGGKSLVRMGSGFEKEVFNSNLKKNEVSDPFMLTCCGVGYLGYDVPKSKERTKILRVWIDMINRCYNQNDACYKNYGGKGVYVCKKWLCFSEFYYDVRKITGFYFKKSDWSNYQLDKDHYSGKVYSPETCIWLPKSMNSSYSNLIQFEAINENGNIFRDINITKFCKKHNLNAGKVSECLSLKRKQHKGYTFRKVSEDEFRLRYVVPVDQLKVLVNKIKKGIDDRRLIVSSWNPSDFSNMGLLPCHYSFQVNLSPCGTYIDMLWNQRSVDLALGANNTLYGLLLHLLAHEAGRIPRFLTVNYGNVHIYRNQIEQVKEQIQRPQHKLPTLKLKEWMFNDIFDWTADCVELKNYNHSGKLVYPKAAV